VISFISLSTSWFRFTASGPRIVLLLLTRNACAGIQEWYIIQYRDGRGQLHFSFVPANLIAADGRAAYGPEDICAVVRK
jgi:hypothetical protein